MKYLKIITLICLFLWNGNVLIGQENFTNFKFDTTVTYSILLEDETKFIADIIEWDSVSVTIKTASISSLNLLFRNINKINEILPENLVDGKYWFENPHATRYLFAPSAYNLKKGEGYYQNAWLVLNSFNVGITDYFSFGGGIELISTFGEGEPIFFLTPKVGFEVKENINIGGGIIYASLGGFDEERINLGISYGIFTYGPLDHNFTAGLGWGFIDGEFSERPIFVFSGITRIGKKWSFVTENWIAPIEDEYIGIYSYGIRFFGEKIAIDLAFINNQDIFEAIFIGIPYIDFVVKF